MMIYPGSVCELYVGLVLSVTHWCKINIMYEARNLSRCLDVKRFDCKNIHKHDSIYMKLLVVRVNIDPM